MCYALKPKIGSHYTSVNLLLRRLIERVVHEDLHEPSAIQCLVPLVLIPTTTRRMCVFMPWCLVSILMGGYQVAASYITMPILSGVLPVNASYLPVMRTLGLYTLMERPCIIYHLYSIAPISNYRWILQFSSSCIRFSL